MSGEIDRPEQLDAIRREGYEVEGGLQAMRIGMPGFLEAMQLIRDAHRNNWTMSQLEDY